MLVLQNLLIFARHYFRGYGFPWDFVGSYYASTAFWTQAAQHGSIPEWVPYQWMGYPFFMNPQAGLFYPPLWIFPLLRIPYTLHAAVVLQSLHVLAGALGMYVFVRVLLRSRRLALIGAFGYQLFGGFFGNAEHVDIVRAYALTPWLLATLTFRPSDRTIPTRLLFVPLVLFLLASGGYPGNFVAALLMSAVYLLLQFLATRPAVPLRTIAILASAVAALAVFGLAMASAALGPAFLFRSELARYHLGPEISANFSFDSLSSLFLPNNWLPGDISMTSTFVGLTFVAALFFLPRRSWKAAVLPALVGVAAGAMAGGPSSFAYRAVRAAIPPSGSSRFPTSDYRAWLAIGLITCGVVSLRALRRRPMPLPRAAIRLVALVAFFVWALHACHRPHWSARSLVVVLVALAGVLGGLLFWQQQGRRGRWRLATGVVLTIIAADASRVVLRMQTWAVPDILAYCRTFYPPPALLAEQGLVVAPEVLSGRPGPRPARLDPGFANYPSSGYLLGTYNVGDFGNLLFESKRRIDASPTLRSYMRRGWMPVLAQPAAARRAPDGWEFPVPPDDEPSSPPGTVRQTWYGLDRISYAVSLERPTLMIENESFFPGWTATLETRRGKRSIGAEPVDGALRGWLLPAGAYSMEARFRFPRYPFLLAASAIGALFWIGSFALVRAAPGLLSRGKSHPRKPGVPETASPRPIQSEPVFAGMASLPGRCNICGRETRFYYRDAAAYREELVCRHCLATSRYRSIARGILRAIRELTGVQASSLAGLAAADPRRPLAVYDTQVAFRYLEGPCAYPIPEVLDRVGWIRVESSLHRPGETPGKSLRPGVTNQDIERLTFPDASFDIVLTSDVMEHVRRADLAHGEIRRVLKPDGVYVFTVPHFRDRPTLERVRLVDPADPSRDEYPFERVYHGDANSNENRTLVYREWGSDLDDALRAIGFDVQYEMTDRAELGILNTELFYCRLPDVPSA